MHHMYHANIVMFWYVTLCVWRANDDYVLYVLRNENYANWQLSIVCIWKNDYAVYGYVFCLLRNETLPISDMILWLMGAVKIGSAILTLKYILQEERATLK